MLTLVFALASALGYGSADFLAGVAARRAGVIQISLLVYAAGVVTMLVILPWTHHGTPLPSALAWGTLSGSGCGVGALFLAAGFRRAPFSIAGPLSAVVGAGLSVVVGVALGERPAGLAWGGLLLALPAIFAVSMSTGRGAAAPARGGLGGVGFGTVAGVGCAVSLVGLGRAGAAAGIWPVLAAQIAALLTIGGVSIWTGDLRLPTRRAVWPSVLSGIIGASAGIFYSQAAHAGLMAIAAVVTSLFPMVTVGLALAFADERPNALCIVGLALVVASVSLIAAGGNL